MIRITSKVDGFRRAGLAHSASPTDHPNDTLTKAQLLLLQAEPMLVVEVLNDDKIGDKKPTNPPAVDAAIKSTAKPKTSNKPETKSETKSEDPKATDHEDKATQ
jgi:hypothetical protein